MDKENRSPPDETSSSPRQTSPQENFNRLQHKLSTLERQVEEKQCRPIPNKHEMLSLLKIKREICLTRERLCIILETNDPSRREKHKRKRQQETSTKEIFERNITELESIIERAGGVDSQRLGITALPGEPESRRVNPSIEEIEALLVDNVPLTVQATSMREQVEAVDERREGQTSISTEGAVGGVTSAKMMLTTSVTGLDDKSETVKIDSRDDCNESKQHLKLPSSPVDNPQTPTEEEKEDLYQIVVILHHNNQDKLLVLLLVK